MRTRFVIGVAALCLATGGLMKVAAPASAYTLHSTVSIGDASIVEGDTGVRTMLFPVTLSLANSTGVTVRYTISSGTATGGKRALPGIDFNNRGGAERGLNFKATEVKKSPVLKYISVPVYGDTDNEGDETFTINLFDVSASGTIVRGTGTGTIIDDDPGTGLRAGVGDVSMAEGDDGTRTLKAMVSLSSAPGATTVTVPYAVTAGTATYGGKPLPPADYTGKTAGTLVFTGNTTSKPISLKITPDLDPEDDETITVTLGTPTGATVDRAEGTVTILNDDTPS